MVKSPFCGFLLLTLATNVYAQELSLPELKDRAMKAFTAKDYAQAIEFTEQALSVAQKTHGPESLEAAEFIGNWGALLTLEGKDNEGRAYILQARQIRDKHGVSGVPVGIQTEAFFDRVAENKAEGCKHGDCMPQMLAEPSNCDFDFDRDGQCGNGDLTKAASLVGKCMSEAQDVNFEAFVMADTLETDTCLSQQEFEIVENYIKAKMGGAKQ